MKCRTGLWVKYRRWGNRFGALKKFLSIHPDRDVRTGASKGGENLRPNGNKVRETKRGLVFAFIYEGVANWSQVDGVVTLKQKKAGCHYAFGRLPQRDGHVCHRIA